MEPDDPIYGYLTIYQKYETSKHVHTRHRICRCIRKYLVLKINPNKGQTLGTMAEGKRKNMVKYEGGTIRMLGISIGK